jgi:hypothetical protein
VVKGNPLTISHVREHHNGLGTAVVIHVLMYAGFGILMVACLWFIDRTLKYDGD